ncbi:MAG: carbohydrate kinase family protein [Candidatus Izemoplasmatales bacterium]
MIRVVTILGKDNHSILCIGACNIDYKFKAKEKIIKKTSNPVDSTMSYGGVVRNIGENLSRLGQKVSLMSLIGQDILGEKLIEDIKEMMDISLVEQTNKHSTGQYYAVINKDGDMDVAYANMSIYQSMDETWIKKHAKIMKNFDYVIADLNVQKSAMQYLIQNCKKQVYKLAVIGVSGPKMKNLPKDLNGLEIIIVNKDESQAYFNLEGDSKSMCKLWLEKGVKKVVVTSGKDDLYFGQLNHIEKLPVIPVSQDQLLDSTGAGDGFSAGVIFGLLQEKPLKEALVYGMVNASLTIQSEHSVRKDINKNELIQEVNDYESN